MRLADSAPASCWPQGDEPRRLAGRSQPQRPGTGAASDTAVLVTARADADVDGFPMAYFNDRRPPTSSSTRRVLLGAASGRTCRRGERRHWAPAASGSSAGRRNPRGRAERSWCIGRDLIPAVFRRRHPPRAPDGAATRCPGDRGAAPGHYNATITHFEPTHSDLWVLRVRPDHGRLPARQCAARARLLGGERPTARSNNIDERWARPSLVLDQPPDLRRARLPGRRGRIRRARVPHRAIPPTPDNVQPDPATGAQNPATASLGPKVAGRYVGAGHRPLTPWCSCPPGRRGAAERDGHRTAARATTADRVGGVGVSGPTRLHRPAPPVGSASPTPLRPAAHP